MDINVTVDPVDLSTIISDYRDEDGHKRTLADAVAWELASQVIHDRDVWPAFRDAVTKIRDDEIRKAVAPLIAEALTKSLQQTNTYGEPTGKTITLSEIIVAEARKQLTEKAGDRYSNDQRSIVAKLVAAEVTSAFENIIKDEVAKARNLVAGDIGARVAAAVQEGLRKR